MGANCHKPKCSIHASIHSFFKVCKRSHKPSSYKEIQKKVAEETKASGITVDEPSEFDIAMEEICEKAEAAERDLQMMSEERKANLEKEKRQAEDMRAKALEKVGETKKREASDDVKKEKKQGDLEQTLLHILRRGLKKNSKSGKKSWS